MHPLLTSGVETVTGSQAVHRQEGDSGSESGEHISFSPLLSVLTREFATASCGTHCASATKMSFLSDTCTCLPFSALCRIPALFGTLIYTLQLPLGLEATSHSSGLLPREF